MRMFEKLGIARSYGYLTSDEEEAAKKVYKRYTDWYESYHGNTLNMKSILQFLFEDTNHLAVDVFLWEKGKLVKTNGGRIGLTVGWTEIGVCGKDFRVCVKTSSGEGTFKFDEIELADVPPEVVEYVKGEVIGLVEKQVDENLRNRIHEKVDEAFGK